MEETEGWLARTVVDFAEGIEIQYSICWPCAWLGWLGLNMLEDTIMPLKSLAERIAT